MTLKITFIAILIFLDMLVPSAFLLIATIKDDDVDSLELLNPIIAYKSKRALKSDELFKIAQRLSASYHMKFGIATLAFTVLIIIFTAAFIDNLYLASALMLSFDIICIILSKIVTEIKLKKEEP